jgi:hypothetical protein
MVVSKSLSWIQTKSGVSTDFKLDLAVHPFDNGKMIINVPGVDGSLDGYNDKYKVLAEYLVRSGVGAVVRIPNPYTFGYGWDINLRHALGYALDNSKEICGQANPEIYLEGFSAGAGAIATIAWEYPEVKKILLVEPAIVFRQDDGLNDMRQYRGQVCIVTGKGSDALGLEVGMKFYDAFENASQREIFEIPNCDHQFRGELNGRILSQAPIYAFADDPKIKFPDPEGGIRLYD